MPLKPVNKIKYVIHVQSYLSNYRIMFTIKHRNRCQAKRLNGQLHNAPKRATISQRPSESGHVCNLMISPARKSLANEPIDSECGYPSRILTGKTFQFQPAVLCLRYRASSNSSPKIGIIFSVLPDKFYRARKTRARCCVQKYRSLQDAFY